MENVDHFPDICRLPEIDPVVNHCMSCASAAYARLKERLFQDRDLKAQAKPLVYYAVALLPAVQNTEIRHLRALEQHHPQFLQRVLGIRWEDRCTNISVLKEENTNNITTILIQHQLAP